MADLDSPLFLKIYDIDFFQDVFFIASEHIEGKSIQAILKERDRLSLAQIINIITQLTRAFGQALKDNVKHRSLTYSDIIYQQNGKIKIIQFHIPRDVISNKEFENKMSSAGSDIFFTGCLFYEFLTHSPLFEINGLSVRNIKTIKDFKLEAGEVKNLSPKQIESLKNIIFKCITSDISARYQSIDELLSALVNFVSEQINKTDILTSMQVDPSKFMKSNDLQSNEKKEDIKLKPAENISNDFKPLSFKNFGNDNNFNNKNAFNRPDYTAENNINASPGGGITGKNIDDSAAYDILFGKKNGGINEPEYPDANNLKIKSFGKKENQEPGNESLPENKPQDNFLKKSNISDKKISAGIWNNKNTSASKGILSKIAGLWYSMMFVVAGFLSFLLYVFW